MSWWISKTVTCPGSRPGRHLSVRAGDGPVRDFSLRNDPAERARYCIAVLREPEGQGSREWHEQVRFGEIVRLGRRATIFRWLAEAEHHLLIAGGIGITPIMSMIAELRRRRADFRRTTAPARPKRRRSSTISQFSPRKGACSSITTAATRQRGST